MPAFPAAPELPGETRFEAFVYPNPAQPLDEPTRRLTFIGEKIAHVVYMDILMARWPNVTPDMISGSFGKFMEDAVDAYRWTQEVAYPPHVNPYSREEKHRLFLTYVGAVHTASRHGYEHIKKWFTALKMAGV